MATEKIIQKLYDGEIEVTFFPVSHRYKVNVDRTDLINVTGVTGLIDKSRPLMIWASRLSQEYFEKYLNDTAKDSYTHTELLPVIAQAVTEYNRVRDTAATIGSMVHDYAEHFAIAKVAGSAIPDFPVKPVDMTDGEYENVAHGINAFLDWNKDMGVEYKEVEQIVYSREHGYHGKFDVDVVIDGKRTLGDYKTGKGMYSEARYQLSAYWAAREEELGRLYDQAMLIHFNKETGELETLTIDREEHEQKNFPVFLALLLAKRREKELDTWGK